MNIISDTKDMWDKNLSNIISEPYLCDFFYTKSHQTKEKKTKGTLQFNSAAVWNDVFIAIKVW